MFGLAIIACTKARGASTFRPGITGDFEIAADLKGNLGNRGMRMGRVAMLAVIAAGWSAGCISTVSSETLAYNYDALGRVRNACHSFGGSGDRVDYALDKADNRNNMQDYATDGALGWNSGWSSADGRFTLWMQPDGNLVLYGPSGALWSTNTVGSGATTAYFASDGNLGLYGPSGQVYNGGSSGNSCATLGVMNDGNVIIVSMDGRIVWQTNTGGH